MSMEYIRKTYGVPAKRGARIEFTDTCGKVHEGRIVGSRGCYLRADMPTIRGGTVTLHPTSDVRYLPNDDADPQARHGAAAGACGR